MRESKGKLALDGLVNPIVCCFILMKSHENEGGGRGETVCRLQKVEASTRDNVASRCRLLVVAPENSQCRISSCKSYICVLVPTRQWVCICYYASRPLISVHMSATETLCMAKLENENRHTVSMQGRIIFESSISLENIPETVNIPSFYGKFSLYTTSFFFTKFVAFELGK